MLIYIYNHLEIYHHGVKGQKWGVRRYQNEDGSLTELGKHKQRKAESGFATHKTLRYHRKAEKLEAKAAETNTEKDKQKAEKAREKATYSAELDARVGEMRKTQNLGKKTGKLLLQGAFGYRGYDYLRAGGYSSISATGLNVVSNLLAGGIGNMTLASVARSEYIKNRRLGAIT